MCEEKLKMHFGIRQNSSEMHTMGQKVRSAVHSAHDRNKKI